MSTSRIHSYRLLPGRFPFTQHSRQTGHPYDVSAANRKAGERVTVLELCSRPRTALAVAELSAHLGARLWKLAQDHPKLLGEAMVFGAIFTVAVRDRARARALCAALFRHRVLAHSICETEPPTLILIPPY